MFKLLLFLSVICVVYTQSDYVRVKRGKYNSSPPIIFYNRPPISRPVQGIFSYTPPPFMEDDSPYPGRRPYKVSKRPTNDGLGDEEINNIMKYLTKQDLNKLIEFATDKTKSYPGNDNYKSSYTRENTNKNVYKGYLDEKESNNNNHQQPYTRENVNKNIYKKYIHSKRPDEKEVSDNYNIKQYLNSYNNQNNEPQYQGLKPSPEADFKEMLQYLNFVTDPTPTDVELYGAQENLRAERGSSNGALVNVLNDAQRSQIQANPQDYESNQPIPQIQNNANSYEFATETYEEEKLPPPINMRTEDFLTSYTNNVPTVVQPSSYKVESFGDLPLMDYNSKLESVNSYSVPHYTVTTQSKPPSPSSYSSYSSSSSSKLKPSPGSAHIQAPPVEPAPPVSAAKEQSDAHLKAIKIWSSKSRGAAYTLHDDGTLTPERSGRPKYG